MSQAKVNSITDQAGTGAPDFPNGFTNPGLEHMQIRLSANQIEPSNVLSTVVFNADDVNTFTTTEYDTSTGIFTATRDGVYQLNVLMQVRPENDSATTDDTTAELVKNGSRVFLYQTTNYIDANRVSLTFSYAIAMSNTDTFNVNVSALVGVSNFSIVGGSTNGPTHLTITKIG